MGAVKNHFHDEICAREDDAVQDYMAVRFPRDHDTDASFCPHCGEPEASPSIEAFEVFGEVMCPDCAAELFEDAGKSHILTAMRAE